MKLMVLNLPRDLTENELARMFKKIGHIKGCDLVFDQKTKTSKGFGFVEMALEHEGVEAIKQLHGLKVGKKKIRVKEAKS